MIAIYKRELRAYYNSMIGWVFTAAMLDIDHWVLLFVFVVSCRGINHQRTP
jgi:hypothetical protein